MEGHHQYSQQQQQQHHQQQQQQQQQQHHHHHMSGSVVSTDQSDRFPQWSIQEAKEFLMIRAELDRTFMETKRNKLLWEVISTKMREKGFLRSAEQCKCKWKNLVTRYKGCETMETEATRQQFPFYNEMQAIFTARMQRMLWIEAEGGGGTSSGSKKKAAATLSSDDDDDENEERESDGGNKNKKMKKGKSGVANTSSGGGGNVVNNIKEILDEFMKQQMDLEMKWRETYEAKEEERKMIEMEWRQTMASLENERMMMDRRWREREEQRRMREEVRAEKRDTLITALLNKLRREDNI